MQTPVKLLTILALSGGVIGLASSPLSGQQRPAAPRATADSGQAYVVPRTPDGAPDLQGFWTNSTYVPLERPDGVTKEFYTPEEMDAIEKRGAERDRQQTTPGTEADVHYDLSQFGLDRSVAGFARNLRTSLIVDPANGKMPPQTPEGQRRNAERAAARRAQGGQFDDVKNMSVGSRCIIMGGSGPPLMDAGYNSNYHIVQSPGTVMILTEMIHDARIIPIDNRPLPPESVRQWVGFSRGRWEGDTLVVETANFNGKNPFRGASANLRVTERFTRVSPDTIIYRFTVEDPSTWERPWTVEERMQKTTGPIFEHACHEGNYGVANLLSGARAEERKAAEDVHAK